MVKAHPSQYTPSPAFGSLSSVALDGYLTAIVIGPNLIMPGKWMGALLQDNPFGTLEQVQSATAAVMEHYNGIISQLDEDPKNYRPLYLPTDPSQPASIERASEWSQGFFKAMRLDDWRPMISDTEARVFLTPIVSFIKHEDGKYTQELKPDELEDILKEASESIADCILFIREYWRQIASPSEIPQYGKRTGRNEQCPCGSGKKYKRCCGAN
jgi:uncharacterized protein